MAVEDHPRYAEWRDALDRFIECEERYREAQMDRMRREEIERRKIARDRALAEYNLIADDIE